MKCEITFAATVAIRVNMYMTSTSLRVGLLRILEADNGNIILHMTNFVNRNALKQVICNKSKKFPKTSWQETEKCSIINAIGVLCLNPYTSKRRRKTWKEHISPKSCTEKKNTALWRECPQETVARFLQEDVQRAEQGFPTKNKRQAARRQERQKVFPFLLPASEYPASWDHTGGVPNGACLFVVFLFNTDLRLKTVKKIK